MFGEYKEWSEQEWIEYLNNIEPILFTYCDYYTENCLIKERIRCIWQSLNGILVRIAFDYEKMQWVAIYIPGGFIPSMIKNPDSEYFKKNHAIYLELRKRSNYGL